FSATSRPHNGDELARRNRERGVLHGRVNGAASKPERNRNARKGDRDGGPLAGGLIAAARVCAGRRHQFVAPTPAVPHHATVSLPSPDLIGGLTGQSSSPRSVITGSPGQAGR